ncbi:MAG: hypothetical protein IPL87_04940 [Candidatus Moraniibacteriota bacterium]|nr:MAG: hypothetical protein IPL87_04940 [Candidatus Moranbacteria bacterium]
MKWSLTLGALFLAVGVAFFSGAALLWYIDPETAGFSEWALVGTTFFLLSGGIGSGILLLVRKALFGEEEALFLLGKSFRQGALLSLFAMSLLVFFQRGWLVWWGAVFLFLPFLLIEIFFLRLSQSRTQKKTTSGGISRLNP